MGEGSAGVEVGAVGVWVGSPVVVELTVIVVASVVGGLACSG